MFLPVMRLNVANSLNSLTLRRIALVAILVLAFGAQVSAQRRTESEAMRLAAQFIRSEKGAGRSPELVRVGGFNMTRASLPVDAYYILADTASNSSVIISGDERMRAVIGYLPDAVFDYNTAPPALLEMLRSYAAQYEFVQSGGASYSYFETPAAEIEPVEQLLKTEWAQYEPYNNMCPIINGTSTLSGCLAMAMAQVMRYYNYPRRGNGSFEYRTTTHKVSVYCDFKDSKYYEWGNMLDKYTGRYSDAQASAVANLAFACGASVGMDYTYSNSVSYYCDMPYALVNNFSYAPSARFCQRDYYNQEEWMNMLVRELQAGRPVIYSGQDEKSGGHAFVLDGVSPDGLFHVNWGWGGQYNGFFGLDAMRPNSDFYNFEQTALVGVNPEYVDSPAYVFYADSFVSDDKEAGLGFLDSFRLHLYNVWNFSNTCTSLNNDIYFKGSLGVAQYDENGELVQLLCEVDISDYKLPMWWGFSEFIFYVSPYSMGLDVGERCYLVPVTVCNGVVTKISTYNYGATDYMVVKRASENTVSLMSAEEARTGITPVLNARPYSDAVYDLNGRTVPESYEGIKIIGGKKVLN